MYFNDSNEKSLSQVIKELYENYQIKNKIFEQKIINNYPKIVGVLINNYTQAIYIKNNILFLKLSSPVIKNELLYAKEKLCKSLNESVGKEIINKIVFL